MKRGDIVLLKPKSGTSWNTEMAKFAGKCVTISYIDSRIFTIDDDFASNIYNLYMIERLANEEEIATYKEALLAIEKELDDKGLFYKMEDIKGLAEAIYGEENVSGVDTKGHWDIVIKFPEVDITNSKNDHHKIKDLYVKIGVSANRRSIAKNLASGGYLGNVDLSGWRQTMSLREYESSYGHSHLPSSYSEETFCLGSSQLRMIIEELRLVFTEEMWMLFLLSLKNYVSWESIEGGPHRRISNISYAASKATEELERELDKMIGNIPHQFFEFRDGIKLNAFHPDLYEFFDKNSTIKSTCGYSKEEIKQKVTLLNAHFSITNGFLWKGETLHPTIFSDDDGTEQTRIKEEVVVRYTGIIEKKAEKFIKAYKYESERQKYKERVFGKVRIEQHTNTPRKSRRGKKDRVATSESGQ